MSDFRFFFASVLVWSGYFCSVSNTQAFELELTPAPSDGYHTHTHTSTPPAEPAPLLISLPKVFEAYQTAGVCFMGFGGCGSDGHFNKGSSGGGGNGSGGDDFDIDPQKQCQNEGFTVTSCPAGSAASGICPYDNRYFSSCQSYDKLCKQDNYYKACSGGLVLDPSQSCDYDSTYKKCVPAEEKCRDEGYVESCDEGRILDPGQACPYDGSYQKCVCNPCDGYDYTYAEAVAKGYEIDGAACNSCGNLRYKRKAKECLGFLPCDCGGEIGAAECWSGSRQMFASCKSCYTECTNGKTDVANFWCSGALKCFFKP